jgi:hypothetical protein
VQETNLHNHAKQHVKHFFSVGTQKYNRGFEMNLRHLYRMSQEVRSISLQVIVWVILSKKVYMYMCPIPNGFRDKDISLHSSKTVDKRYVVLFLIPVFIVQVKKVGTVYLVWYNSENSTVNINAL